MKASIAHSLSRSFKRLSYTAMVLGLVSATITGCSARGDDPVAPPPPKVEVASVLEQDITLWDDFTGRLVAPQTVELRPRVNGYIDSVNFEEGALVHKGDTLFVIDPRPYQARANAAEAERQQRQSQLTLARSEAERAEQLLKNQAISREEFDQRQARLQSAQAALSAADAALESAMLELEYTQVKAPVSGRVGLAHITEGNLAGANETLLTTIVSIDPMYVYFESDEETARGVLQSIQNRGFQTVQIGLAGDPGHPHQGQIDFVDNHLNPQTGTLRLRARLSNPDGQLKPGQFARVLMPIQYLTDALLVDQKAVLTDQDRRFVYVVTEDNRTDRRQVVTGRRSGGLLVIEEGLRAGERIVINGLQKVRASGVEITPQIVAMDRESDALAATP
ncbi:efflux RND transporter periplasmic adaptor subunit [Marinimicrobium agarilyticum]|uniref:efflux RND transporter periplasmic adaptor subunit n=1 Tax=Marinimicrobium agarilyticum TaxID=306546 RepID=UPI000408F684|nr:efflux RND transporter periplasmic adaptor subunit [Marinimicrobium agarilyticum]